MPLSEYEQRVLDQLEHDLGQDQSLHRAMNRSSRTPTRVIVGITGVVAGLGVVIAGVATQLPLVGIAGFALMAGFALWILLGSSKPEESAPAAPRTPQSSGPASAPKAPRNNKDFMQRFEERFDRRRDNNEF